MAERTIWDTPPEASSSPVIPEEIFSSTPLTYRQESCDPGHDINIDFSLTNAFLIPEDWEVVQEFTTLCETTPTSWYLRIIIDKTKNYQANFKGPNVVSGDVKLKRTDDVKEKTVMIFMEMKVYHQRFGYHTLVQPFDASFKSDHATFLYISNIVPSGHKDLLLNAQLDFNVRLSIRDCHQPLTPPPKPPVKTPEKKSPKERKPLPIEQRWHHTLR